MQIMHWQAIPYAIFGEHQQYVGKSRLFHQSRNDQAVIAVYCVK